MDSKLTPYYIQDAVRKRARAAASFLKNDLIITEYCEKNNLNVEYIGGRVETIMEYEKAAEITLEEIEAELHKLRFG